MKKVALSFIALSLVALAGCKDPTPVEIVDLATKEFGMPVLYWADLNDECAVRQLRQLWSDYSTVNKKTRKAIVKRLRDKYAALIMNPSEDAGEVTGTVRELMLVDRDCRADVASCRKHMKASKLIADLRRSDSSLSPGTRIVRERQGQIIPYAAHDKSTKVVLATADAELYRYLDTAQDLENALRVTRVWGVGTENAQAVNCGRIANIGDLY